MEWNVALVQTALDWEDPKANRNRFDKMLEDLSEGMNSNRRTTLDEGAESSRKLDLVVLPEMFSSGFTMEPGNLDPGEAERTLDWMRDNASRLDAAVTGSIVWPLKGGGYANRMVFMRPEGTYQYYDKRHTFTLAGEDQVYRRGESKEIWEFRGFKICPQICYDLRFPVFSRNTEDYDLLLYVANWPDTRVDAWDALLKARAIENMAFVLGVNRLGDDPNDLRYTGHTSAYGPLGSQIAFSEHQEVLQVTLNKEVLLEARKTLRFLDDRDPFTPGWGGSRKS